MRFAWDKTAVAVAAVLALAACGRGDASSGANLEERARAAAFFMESNSRAEGIQTLPSGLQYKVIQSGPSEGETPDSNDLVRVDYEGSLTDGTVFDSSFTKGRPFVTTPEQVVPGWTEALQMMRVGDEWMLYVPPALGYGEQGGGNIPPNSVLVFRVRMLDIARAPGGTRGVGVANG